MSKANQNGQIQMIPVDRIHILNPRVRNKKIFSDIVQNISNVGLKRPITVTNCQSGAPDKDYDLICGQGRLEAFIACGQSMIPARVIDASEEDALIMSLVENLARPHHKALDLLQGVEALRKKYDVKTIAQKTGLCSEYVYAVINLLERGENRLISAVESGQMPVTVALQIATSPGDEQRALQEAYEKNLLRGKKLFLAQQLIATRKRRGKTFQPEGRAQRKSRGAKVSAEDLVRVYQKEVDRKSLFARKARQVSDTLTFVTEGLRQLFQEEHFNTLLRAEQLTTLPKQLAALVEIPV